MFIPLKAAALVSTLIAANAHANFDLPTSDQQPNTKVSDDYHLLIG